jgi:hypothetical protein
MCQHTFLSTGIIVIHVYSYLVTCLLNNPKARHEVESNTLQGSDNKDEKQEIYITLPVKKVKQSRYRPGVALRVPGS